MDRLALELKKALRDRAELLKAAKEVMDWLEDVEPGTDQYERMLKLRAAISRCTKEAA